MLDNIWVGSTWADNGTLARWRVSNDKGQSIYVFPRLVLYGESDTAALAEALDFGVDC